VARPKDENKRKEIINSAFEIFGKKGFESTTIKDIAEQANVASGSVYNYFENKEDLFKATVEEGWNDLLSEMEKISNSNEHPLKKFENLMEYGFQTLENAIPLLKGMLFKANQHEMLHDNLEKFYRNIEKLLLEGKRVGLLNITDDPEQLASGIKIIVAGVLFSVAMAKPEEMQDEVKRLKKAIRLMIEERLIKR